MADKSVGELIAAQSVTPTDLFVLEQNGTAKKLTGQILENWLVSFADGHGGIQTIEKVETVELVDTYRITLADTTTFDFAVTNGRGVRSIERTSTEGLSDTYTITYNDNTTNTFTITNGAKGDKGDNAYIWVKYASQEPTSSAISLGDIPDAWMGIYVGISDTAPTSYSEYKWYQIKGEKGDTGAPASLVSTSVTYQTGDSGTIIPSGSWSTSIPSVVQGKYLWTREITQFNTGNPITKYSVSRFGIDGSGSVSSVAGVSPGENGNVPLAAADIGAVPDTGGDMAGELRMNGQPISGLNAPTANDQAANMGFVNQRVKKAAPHNLLDNSDFRNPVNQRGQTNYTGNVYTIDRWRMNGGSLTVNNGISFTAGYALYQPMEKTLADGVTKTFALRTEDGIYCTIIRGEYSIVGDSGYSVAYDDGTAVYIKRLTESEKSIEWVALYEGEYTIDTLPEYHPKSYSVELAECQRYFMRFASRVTLNGMATGEKTLSVDGIIPSSMRIVPTISFSGDAGSGGAYQGSTGVGITAAEISAVVSASIMFSPLLSIDATLTKAHGIATYREAMVRLPAFTLDADL